MTTPKIESINRIQAAVSATVSEETGYTITANVAVATRYCESITDGRIADPDGRLIADFNTWQPSDGSMSINFQPGLYDRSMIAQAIATFITKTTEMAEEGAFTTPNN